MSIDNIEQYKEEIKRMPTKEPKYMIIPEVVYFAIALLYNKQYKIPRKIKKILKGYGDLSTKISNKLYKLLDNKI